MSRPLILISNDDSYKAKGINELVRFVRHLGDVIVCAPMTPQSGKSRAFSFSALHIEHLRSDEGVEWYGVDGTPVDCVKMAYGKLCSRKPDLVIGGINHGDNASTNAHYSGTIGVVFEGALKGIPSVAFSLCDYDEDANFEPMRDIIVSTCERVLKDGLPKLTCLNINVPKCNSVDELKGVKVCRMSRGGWVKEVSDKGVDENNIAQYMLEGYYENHESNADDTDAWALAHGYIAVTPCTIDITSYELYVKIKSWYR